MRQFTSITYIFKPRRIYGALPYDLKNYKNELKNQNKFPNYQDKSNLIDNSTYFNDSMISPSNNPNKVYRFSDYTERKDTFKTTQIPILTYLNPQNPLDNVKQAMVSFNKMKKRNGNDIIINTNSPAVCYYKPKYDFILNNHQNTVPFKRDVNISRKYLVKKMWGSYDVSTDYKFVKLKSYVDEKFNYRGTK